AFEIKPASPASRSEVLFRGIQQAYPGVFDEFEAVGTTPANDPPGHFARAQLETLGRVLEEIVTVGQSMQNGQGEKSGPGIAQAAPHVAIYGNVFGSLQTGVGSTSTVTQSWASPEHEGLARAILSLQGAIADAATLQATEKDDLREELDRAVYEIQKKEPNKSVLLRTLAGVGAVIQTLGSASEAWDAVKAAAAALGVPLQ
ncbi:MAG: hypothetical protein ABI919_07915, partial [Ramlibacter sp.]